VTAIHSDELRTGPFPMKTFRSLRACLTCAICVLVCVSGSAQGWERTIAQFQHTAWGPKDGASGVVRALAQTSAGYLWLGSPDGLYRFDGVVFERYQPQSGGPFPARPVNSLLALPNGDLWIGFLPGVITVLRNGNATNYTGREGVPAGGITGLAPNREGTIWAAAENGLAWLEGVDNVWQDAGTRRAAFYTRLGPSKYHFRVIACNNDGVWNEDGELLVSVMDNGVGLPAGRADKIFNAFFTTKPQGTGLGLAITRSIVESHGGRIWATANSERGTTFYFTLSTTVA